MNPELPADDEVLDNPYQYTEYKSDSTHGARGTVFGEPRLGTLKRAMAGRGRRDPTSSRPWPAGSTCWRASTPTTAR